MVMVVVMVVGGRYGNGSFLAAIALVLVKCYRLDGNYWRWEDEVRA